MEGGSPSDNPEEGYSQSETTSADDRPSCEHHDDEHRPRRKNENKVEDSIDTWRSRVGDARSMWAYIQEEGERERDGDEHGEQGMSVVPSRIGSGGQEDEGEGEMILEKDREERVDMLSVIYRVIEEHASRILSLITCYPGLLSQIDNDMDNDNCPSTNTKDSFGRAVEQVKSTIKRLERKLEEAAHISQTEGLSAEDDVQMVYTLIQVHLDLVVKTLNQLLDGHRSGHQPDFLLGVKGMIKLLLDVQDTWKYWLKLFIGLRKQIDMLERLVIAQKKERTQILTQRQRRGKRGSYWSI